LAGGPIRKEAVHEKKSPLISDSFHPHHQFLRSLHTVQGRRDSGRYLIEGIRHVARAFEDTTAIESIFIEPSVLRNPFGQKLARRIRQQGVPCVRLAPPLYQRLTLASEPQGIGAVAKQRWQVLSQIDMEPEAFWLAVESVDLPGNLGTMLRTAEAAGVSGVIFVGDGADPHDPACLRATMGALFPLKLVRCTLRDFVLWARQGGVCLVGSSPRGLMNYRAFRCRWPAVLVIGSEREGISDQLMDACDFALRIPMRGKSDSINAAVAAGVLLFQLAGQVPGRR
jgi:TrmH family RNA methyltransferase